MAVLEWLEAYSSRGREVSDARATRNDDAAAGRGLASGAISCRLAADLGRRHLTAREVGGPGKSRRTSHLSISIRSTSVPPDLLCPSARKISPNPHPHFHLETTRRRTAAARNGPAARAESIYMSKRRNFTRDRAAHPLVHRHALATDHPPSNGRAHRQGYID